MVGLDDIIYAAIMADSTLLSLTNKRVYSTCIEVPPTDEDNTPLPYLVILDDAFRNSTATKDTVWESDVDIVQASVIISAKSPSEVKHIRRLVRNAVANHIASLQGNIPYLTSLTNDGVAWDWQKPCYYDTLHYQCEMDIVSGDVEQTND